MSSGVLSFSFLAYALLCLAAVAGGLRATLGEHDGKRAVAIMVGWVGFSAFVASGGFLEGGGGRQPRVLVILVPMLAFLFWLGLSPRVGQWARGLRTDLLMAAQAFRVGVEVFLYFLWQAQIVPRVMTFEGRNVDMLVGLSAPVIAWAYRRYPSARPGLRVPWNLSGMAILLNVVGHGILSAPGPQRMLFDDVPNRAIVVFPYVYLATVFVLLAFSLHILSLRSAPASRGR